MKGPYGFELNESCQTYKLHGNGFFSQLSQAALKDLDAVKFISAYPQDAVLFMEKQTPRGIYVLCEGEVKLSVSSSEGKKLILRIAKAGEVLGLMSAFSNTPMEVTAETMHPCQVAFVRRDDFLRFLIQHPEAYPVVARQLGSHYQTAAINSEPWAFLYPRRKSLPSSCWSSPSGGRKRTREHASTFH